MRKQHLLETRGDLLDGDGYVTEAGYAFSPVLNYDVSAIKAPKNRIKEWDYYMIISDESAVAFTLSDQTYAKFDTIGFMDFTVPRADTLRKLPLGGNKRLYCAPGEPVNHSVKYKKLGIDVMTSGGTTHITAHADRFFGAPFDADITLFNEPTDRMVIVTPFTDRRYFYYNLKTNCIDVEGVVKAHGKEYKYVRGESFACYDCGRGAWTKKNRWYWLTLSASADGNHKFGMNLGYGFGDTSAASENMLFYDGKASKLGDVKIDVPMKGKKEDFLGGDWKITDDDGRVDMIFKPIVVRKDAMNAVFISTYQNQTFGRLYGTAVLDSGHTVTLNGEIGACEIFDNNA